jgi:UDP-N-acetylglucosamine 2-epimerase (non-hydrolysing)
MIIGGVFISNHINSATIKNNNIAKILAVFGTRPEAIKMAPVVNALMATGDFQIKTVVTAQHREMLDQVLAIFGIQPDFDLNIMSPGQSLTEITCRVLRGLDPVLKAETPDLLLVHGDTTTTFAGSLAAFYQHIEVGHVEAGLRTGDKQQPYPEELNRLLTGRIADLHFAPTAAAKENLLRENIPAQSIMVTGNTVIDALHHCLQNIQIDSQPDRRFILVTAHRRESWGLPLENVVKALKNIIKSNPKVNLLIPVHLNPQVRKIFFDTLGSEPQVKLVEPLDYQAMVKAIAESYLVITDSGGIQEEAPALGKPVLVLREKTERPEAVVAGTVKLVGTDTERITATVNSLLNDPSEYLKMSKAVNPYGDGKATTRIIAGLRYHFGFDSNQPMDFSPS